MWSYSGDPANSPSDTVRFLIGDTEKNDQLLQDAEIKYLLNLYGGAPLNAAIRACEMIIGKFSRLADETAGQVRINFSQKAKGYRAMLTDLRMRIAIDDMTPICGGISIGDKIATSQDQDRVKPEFTKHMMENQDIAPWVTNQPGQFNGDQSGN